MLFEVNTLQRNRYTTFINQFKCYCESEVNTLKNFYSIFIDIDF